MSMRRFYAEGDGGGTGVEDKEGAAKEGAAKEGAAKEGAAKEGAAKEGAAVTPPAKKYTDEDVNNMIARGKADAVAATLKELGLASVDDAKKNLATLKAWQDSQKTAEQKAKDDAAAADKRASEAEARALQADLRVEALRAGVDPEKLDDALVLAEKAQGATPADKVKSTLEKRPWLFAKGAPESFGASVKGQKLDEKAKMQADVNAAFGLPNK
jgi:hypothetical protein